MTDVAEITLASGTTLPLVGFGVFQVPPEATTATVASAIEAGYRSFDTAAAYRNEAEVGAALRASGLPREELTVTTKLWNGDQGFDEALAAFDASAARLDLGYVDLYLIHWPAPARDRYVDSWRAMERLHADGRARAIGVSNFTPAHLTRLMDETSVVPAVNQIELHPRLAQRELRAFHAKHGILTEAWSPLARGGVLAHPTVVEVAARHGVTPAQVVLRWHLQLGNRVIPRSVNPGRIRENFALWGFALDDADMELIDGLDAGGRIGPDPDVLS